MENKNLTEIEDIEIDYLNIPIRIVFLQDQPKIRILGNIIGPFKKGEELAVPRWVGKEIVDEGIAKYHEKEKLSLKELSKVHWRESLPTSRQLPLLEEDFYCKLRSLLSELKELGKNDVTRLKEYEKVLSISNDIVNCRLMKLVIFSASAFQSGDLMKNLTLEERSLLEVLSKTIQDWRENILEMNSDGKYSGEP
jgi:hypothetical protein